MQTDIKPALSADDIATFIRDGFIRIDNAFSKRTAEQARAILLEATRLPRDSLGTFPVRFPSRDEPGDDGWHVDVSFGYENPDFMELRANLSSRGRALLMLFLFSDVGGEDAPTRISRRLAY
jgi:hypothetical protein